LAGAVLVLLLAGMPLARAQAPSAGAPAAAPVPLRTERLLGGGRGVGPAAGPAYARADKMTGILDESTLLEGAVEVRHQGVVLRGERVLYLVASDELQVRGKVHLVERGASFDGPALDFKLEAHTGRMPNASYSYPAKKGRGESRLIEFLDEDNIRLHEATYTTCRPDDPSWWIKAETIDINRVDGDAVTHATTLYFEGVPVFVSPYFELPLTDERRSGLLAPGYTGNSRLGEEFIFPIYWNIAPNRDYTGTPDIIPRRGISMGNEFRFLEPQYKGQLNYDVMPNDRTTGTMRDHLMMRGQFADFNGLHFDLNYNRVSDDNYLIDFSHNIVNAAPEVLPQEAVLSYTQPYWNATLRMSKSQTLVSLLAVTDPGPYERVPGMTINAQRADWHGFDFTNVFDVTRFQHPAVNPCFQPPESTIVSSTATSTCPTVLPTAPYTPTWFSQDGSRMILNPGVSYPLVAPGWFVVPKVQWHYTNYQLDPNFHLGDTVAVRSLPISSLDAGLVFERPSAFLGQSAHQTLEPRVFYAFVPYRDQSRLPNFDSADADFNFAQLFTENTFTGSDRIAQANQITTALVSRVIDDASGAERLRLALGQRFYFGSQLVTLPGDVPRTNLTSDVLALGSAAVGRKWSVDVALDYSSLSKQLAQATFGFRWQPRAASVLNIGYRYETAALAGTTTSVDQLRSSAQWPLSAHWYGVAALDYSISERGWVQTVGGLEYKADCWVGRLVLSRYAVTLPNSVSFSNNYTTTWFFQIELNGLTNVGPSPLDTLQSTIPGYQRVNPLSGPGGPFEHYE
jgi:LPS-assembly protein